MVADDDRVVAREPVCLALYANAGNRSQEDRRLFQQLEALTDE